jgi:hypothetical protein
VRLQCVPKSYRIVPNLADGVLLVGTPVDHLLAAPAIQADDFDTGRDVLFNQPLPAALTGVFSHRHSLLHCFGGCHFDRRILPLLRWLPSGSRQSN